ncbi:cytochrome c biogenesis protein ResB [Hydromonas duriensis]|uniref:Cytochrome c biogenesis protein n=1 Tax=Hydromonas duriensis TaxID=1527608 RepID=A0A4R6Y9M4_9BURK|nr:cytochrome c biogenesis protein ResB [Hydromonas duriensis]TDR32183.1 cytochrome c biogenesis protein [Hydromonas duriensis]
MIQPQITPKPTRPVEPIRARLWDFLGSMRLAISLLSILAIASTIGTLVKQNDPMVNYIDQFGLFWAKWFDMLGFFDVYNQVWFLIILAFLLLSTSVCLIRNTPKMLRDMRTFKEHTRTNTLRHLHEHQEWTSDSTLDELTKNSVQVLKQKGYQVRAQQNAEGVYIAAKRGRYSRLGYVLTHLAIVVICIGGLMDSELSIRAQVHLFGKKPQANTVPFAQVPPDGVLPIGTMSYRGDVKIPEGAVTDVVSLTYNQDSYLLQNLPFVLRLNRFVVDYYSTGMPKRFASDVTVQDKQTGETFNQTIEVNHPLRYKGVAVYQAGFDDGGSRMQLAVYPMSGTVAQPAQIDATMYANQTFNFAGEPYTIQWREFKPINVEDLAQASGAVLDSDSALTHAMSPISKNKALKNVGPVMQFVLLDKAGNALEFRNYMSPITLDGVTVFLSGVRSDPNKDFLYLRIPADSEQTMGDFMRMRAALSNTGLREKAIKIFASKMRASQKEDSLKGEELEKSLTEIMNLFAQGGLQKLGESLQSKVPEGQRDAVAQTVTRLLEGTLWELLQVARVEQGLSVLPDSPENSKFTRLAIVGLSDAFAYGAPVYVQLKGFEQVQASVLQMTKSPGQFWVYMGSLMLVLGTLFMTFIRERRVWLHIRPNGEAQQLILAMSSTRRTFDYHRAWNDLREALRSVT